MEYRLEGNSFPVVVCSLTDGEKMITEKGSMVWMSPNMEMTTSGGGVKKMLGKMVTGESIFHNTYQSRGNGMIAFGSSFPGKILALDIAPGKDIILQKSAFLAAEYGVRFSVHFHKRFGGGLVGGEGFLMQRFSGSGKLFAEIDGDVVSYNLEPGQQLLVDTGSLAGFESTVQMDVQTVKGVKNMVFGGEGLFHTVLTGPGKVYLQTLSIKSLAEAIIPYVPTGNS